MFDFVGLNKPFGAIIDLERMQMDKLCNHQSLKYLEIIF